jgi:hypothetical protein
MDESIDPTLHRLEEQRPGRISRPADDGYVAATAIWAKPVGAMPRAVVHCETAQDVQAAIQAARMCDLALSVRGGGHDWAGRALCDGLVIDLRGMNHVSVDLGNATATIGGGARACDVLKAIDPLGLAAVTGSVGAVGMAGLTLGGGYGPLSGRFGLALDNLLAAEVVLANGSIVTATHDSQEELFWAMRGGGGNFGVVTAMQLRLHGVSSVRSGILVYAASEAKAVLGRCAEIAASMPEELTVQVGFIAGPDGAPVVFITPTWCGRPEDGEARIAPFLKLGTLVGGAVEVTSYRSSLAAFDAYSVNGQRTFMDTCWLAALDSGSIDVVVEGDGDRRLARLRHRHPRIQGRSHTRAAGRYRLRAASRPCAHRDSQWCGRERAMADGHVLHQRRQFERRRYVGGDRLHPQRARCRRPNSESARSAEPAGLGDAGRGHAAERQAGHHPQHHGTAEGPDV